MTNRDILFRAKRVDNGEWVYGDFTHDKENRAIIRRIVAQPLFMDENGNFSDTIYACSDYVVDPDTVSQFTGLYDKNGKGIFEGDVLEFDVSNGKNRDIVIWSNGDYNGVTGFRLDKYALFSITETNHQYYEIVGNKWDNPFLL